MLAEKIDQDNGAGVIVCGLTDALDAGKGAFGELNAVARIEHLLGCALALASM